MLGICITSPRLGGVGVGETIEWPIVQGVRMYSRQLTPPNPPHRGELLFAVLLMLFGLTNGNNNRSYLSVHDSWDTIPALVNAVVGDAVLREVVGADFFATVAGADLGLAFGG